MATIQAVAQVVVTLEFSDSSLPSIIVDASKFTIHYFLLNVYSEWEWI